jgi:cell division protein FtsB
MQANLTHYIGALQVGVKNHWKPAVGIAGVAVLVAVIWGKQGLLGFGLIVFSAAQGLGSSFWTVTVVYFKRSVYLGILAGNTYFQVLNPKYVNMLLAACIAIGEIQFSRTFIHLKMAVDNLAETTAQQDREMDTLKQDLIGLNTELETYIETQAKRRKPALVREGTQTPQSLVQDFKDYLGTLKSNTSALRQMAWVRDAKDETGRLRQSYSEQAAKLSEVVAAAKSLNAQLQRAVDSNTSLEQFKTRLIEKLEGVCKFLLERGKAL